MKNANIVCMNFNTVLDDLVFSLKPSDPYKIILFTVTGILWYHSARWGANRRLPLWA